MKENLSDITVVLDRSGSMTQCKLEAENGLNHFIEEQKSLSGECSFTLVQFDTEIEVVHNGIPISGTPKCSLIPRGMTALLDAVGSTINKVGQRLSAMPEPERPGLVVFVIITDGLENSSHEYTVSNIKEMIELQQNKYRWKFLFLGANQDAFQTSDSMGIAPHASANYDVENTEIAFSSVSNAVSRSRTQSRDSGMQDLAFNESERKSMVN